VLILGGFKSLFPEVLILVGLKLIVGNKIREILEILEVLILVDFKSCTMSRSERGEFLQVLVEDL
jgi:hypothetical protein